MAEVAERQQSKTPISVKEAVQLALGYVREIFDQEDIPNLRLEEVVMSQDGRRWRVTVGFTAAEVVVERPAAAGIMSVTGTERRTQKRDYKLLEIDAQTGEMLGLTIRNV